MISRIFSTNLTRTVISKIWKTNATNFIGSSSFNNSRRLYLKTYDKEEPAKNTSTSTISSQTAKQYEKFLPENDSNYKVSNDPDTFGSTQLLEDENEDPGDLIEEEYLKNPPMKSQKLRPIAYARLIKDHLNQKEVKEAIDILEIRMKKDRVRPDKYIFNILISGCGKYGYSRKAFQLFNKMKQHGVPPTGGTYTSLFNACANAPWSQDGLNKAIRLRELMLEKGYEPNSKNYNAMIKAFGRCGDIGTAYLLVDEMIEKNLQIDCSTFNFLLQACASETEYGFRHALLTWHKMRSYGIVPDIYSFNLMLRCVRDCSIGDLVSMEEVIYKILYQNKNNAVQQIEEKNEQILLSESNEIDEKPENINTQLSVKDENKVNDVEETLDETPNFICSTPHLGSLVSISEITDAKDRLLLLGGFSAFLDEMQKHKITPGIETFTALLDVIPSTKSAEKQLISMIRKIGLKSDIDFFNILIKKRSMRFDYDGAREVLNMIKTAKLQPNIVTYGVLALSCQTETEARELLHEMSEKGIRMNIQILGAMLRQGCVNYNFPYVNEILQICLDEKIKPNEAFLKHLDNFYKQSSRLDKSQHPKSKAKNFKINFNKFKSNVKVWYEENNLEGLKLEDAIKKLKGKPYDQFKENRRGGFENVKNSELVRKQKVRKYIKRIKMKDLKDDDDGNKDVMIENQKSNSSKTIDT